MNPELQTFTGSLLLDGKTLVTSYDLEQQPRPADTAMQLKPLHEPGVYNYALRPFSIDYRTIGRLGIINGMGVTLGDSIIGLSALRAIKYALRFAQPSCEYAAAQYSAKRTFGSCAAYIPTAQDSRSRIYAD